MCEYSCSTPPRTNRHRRLRHYRLDAKLAALAQRRAKTRSLKQGMMQELLTGRIRPVSPGGAKN
jgi:hypothetical protein